MIKWYEKNFSWFLPAVFTLIASIGLVIWLKLDTNLPHWDMGRHLFNTIQYRDLWGQFFTGEKNIFGLAGFYAYYPPVVHNLTLPFYALFGTTQDTAVYTNIVWLFILLFSVFNIGHRYWGVKSGLISMLVILSSPILIGQMREFQIDFPLTSIFSLSLYFLIRSENFTNRKYSILAGVVAGLGMMVKWTYAAYAGPAVLLFLFLGQQEKEKRKTIWKNLGLAFAVVLLICGYWYVRNIVAIAHDFAGNGIGVAKLEGDPTGFTKEAFSWYFKNMNRYYLYLPLALLLLVATLTALVRKSFKKNWFIFLLLVVSYLIFSTLPNKDIRYIMPAFIYITLIISSLAALSKNRVYQFGLFIFMIAIFVVNNAAISFGQYGGIKSRETILFKNTGYSFYGVLISGIGGYTAGSPRQQICPVETLVSEIPKKSRAKMLGEDSMFVNDWAAGFFLAKSDRVYSRDLPESDYLLFRDGPSWPSSIDNMRLRDKVTVLKTIQCSDGYNIYLTKVLK